MSTFGDDLIQSLSEAVAHAEGNGPAIVRAPANAHAVSVQAELTEAVEKEPEAVRRALAV